MAFDINFLNNLSSIPQDNLMSAVIGGLLIAAAASMHYFFFGNILGMSGMISSMLRFSADRRFRINFSVLVGVVFSAALMQELNKTGKVSIQPFEADIATSPLKLIISGLLVGWGTKLASGCTSGHGLCGLPRLSSRSITAVLVFLSCGILTATMSLDQHIPASPSALNLSLPSNLTSQLHMMVCGGLFLATIVFSRGPINGRKISQCVVSFTTGIVFGTGLMVAGMSKRSKIYGFLTLNSSWDPSLMVVLGVGVLANFVLFNAMKSAVGSPVLDMQFSNPRGRVNKQLIVGSVLFGVGWGLGGLCPGPMLLLLTTGSLYLPFFWGISCLVGMKTAQFIDDSLNEVKRKMN